MNLKLPTLKECEITLTAEQDELQIRGNALASGDDAFDKKVEDEIIERLENGDVWAWASVKVEVSYKGFSGVDYLGGCSYADEEEFKTDAYYTNMVQQAYDDLLNNMKSNYEVLTGGK